MSIFISESMHPKIMGLAQGLESLGLQVNSRNSKSTPLFDFIEEAKPQAFFLNNEDIVQKEVKFAIWEYPDIKWIWLREELADINTSELDLVVNLNDSLMAAEDDISLPFLGNEVLYGEGKYDPQLATDLLIFSDRLDVKNESLISWINQLGTEFRLKIFGLQRVPSVYYLGQLHRAQYKDAIASAKIVVGFDEEWHYNTLMNGVTSLHFIRTDKDLCEWQFEDYKTLVQKCRTYLLDLSQYPQYDKLNDSLMYKSVAQKIKERLEL
jgi:hypothetical protein